MTIAIGGFELRTLILKGKVNIGRIWPGRAACSHRPWTRSPSSTGTAHLEGIWSSHGVSLLHSGFSKGTSGGSSKFRDDPSRHEPTEERLSSGGIQIQFLSLRSAIEFRERGAVLQTSQFGFAPVNRAILPPHRMAVFASVVSRPLDESIALRTSQVTEAPNVR
jgi:hypothetical protein